MNCVYAVEKPDMFIKFFAMNMGVKFVRFNYVVL